MPGAFPSAPAWYVPVAPRPSLEQWLACCWTARPSGRHRLLPDACIDVLWLSTGEIVLCGPEVAAWWFELPPGVIAAGVRFRPGVAAAVLGLDASTVLDRLVPWHEVVGEAAAATLARQLSEAPDDAARIAVWEGAVEALVASATLQPLAEQVLALVAQSPRSRAGAVAAAVGLTPRQLHRRCLQSFGYGFATLARIVRFHRFWSAASLAAPGTSITAIAHTVGYTDHAHLVRDCRALTGVPPGQFLAESFATFPDMSDPYKTGSGFTGTLSG